MYTRKCVIYNYIPHKTKRNTKYSTWLMYYKNDIINLYGIFKDIIEARHPGIELDWKTLFNKFCVYIFKSSSKHVPNY